MGLLSSQRVLSGAICGRRLFLRPPEPQSDLLFASPSDSVYMGKTAHLRTPFCWCPKKLLNPHICVVGMTGSGKSYFIKTFITRARLALGASALILDWSGEYADWVRAAGGVAMDFGESGVNLLSLCGAPPHQRARQVVEALEILTDISAFPAQRRMTEEAVEKAYRSRGFGPHGWRGGRGRSRKGGVFAKRKPPTEPTLRDALAVLEANAARTRAHDAKEAARRVKSLVQASGNSFCTQGFQLDSLLCGLVCVDLHALPHESLRSLAGLAILQFVKEKMRGRRVAAGRTPSLFIVIDEAWKIASDARSDVVSIVREGRKYGIGLIVSSQSPSDVHQSILSNAGTTVCFRLLSAQERATVRASLSYSDHFEGQSHHLSVGQAIVHLEFFSPVCCPKTFLLGRVEGEEILQAISIRGDGMDLETERAALLRSLFALGLSDSQANGVLAEFERKNNTLQAKEFAQILERAGAGRAQVIFLLRELGASEHGIIALYASLGSSRPGEARAVLGAVSGAKVGRAKPAKRPCLPVTTGRAAFGRKGGRTHG